MRTYVDKKKADDVRHFKGSVFVTFKDRESAEKFMALESVKKDEVDLIRKWQEDYLAEKEKEFEEKLKEKKARKEKKEKRSEEQTKKEPKEEKAEEQLPKGIRIGDIQPRPGDHARRHQGKAQG